MSRDLVEATSGRRRSVRRAARAGRAGVGSRRAAELVRPRSSSESATVSAGARTAPRTARSACCTNATESLPRSGLAGRERWRPPWDGGPSTTGSCWPPSRPWAPTPRPALVLLAFCAAQMLSQVPATPGGLGFVEAGLAATLAAAGGRSRATPCSRPWPIACSPTGCRCPWGCGPRPPSQGHPGAVAGVTLPIRRPTRDRPARLTYLGHATVLLDVGGARLLTDPVLRARVGHLRRHGPTPDPPRDVHTVLISHLHLDHLDLASLRMLDRPVRLRGAARCGRVPAPSRTSLCDRARRGREHGSGRARGSPRRLPCTNPAPAASEARWPTPSASRSSRTGGGATSRATQTSSTQWRTSRGASTSRCYPFGVGGRRRARASRPGQGGSGGGHAPAAPGRPDPLGSLFPLGMARRHPGALRDPPREFAAQVAGGGA